MQTDDLWEYITHCVSTAAFQNISYIYTQVITFVYKPTKADVFELCAMINCGLKDWRPIIKMFHLPVWGDVCLPPSGRGRQPKQKLVKRNKKQNI